MGSNRNLGLPPLDDVLGRASGSSQGGKVVQLPLERRVEAAKPLSVSPSNLKEGLLHVQLTDQRCFVSYLASTWEDGNNAYYNHREVEVTNHETGATIFLNTDSLQWPIQNEIEARYYHHGYDPGVCEKVLPGGNYTIKATVGGETVSRNVTVDGPTRLLLHFHPPKK